MKRATQRERDATAGRSSDLGLLSNFSYDVAQSGYFHACTISDLGESVTTAMGGWPFRIGNVLFVDCVVDACLPKDFRWLENPTQLFSWIHTWAAVKWKKGCDSWEREFVSREELFEHLRTARICREYDAIETSPHEPPIPGHYYSWRPPPFYTPTGEHLKTLLAFFPNGEEAVDEALIKAAFLTPAWGGAPGARPAFAILGADRGMGKSTLVAAVSDVFGGYIDLPVSDKAEDKMLSRLLSSEGLLKRIVRIDNIKGRYGSALVEALVTSPTISGHRLYHGEATRPNNLTVCLTANTLKLSRDISERSVIVRLKKPTMQADWEARLRAFTAANRSKILADIIWALKSVPARVTISDRFPAWCAEVLGRCTPEPDAALEVMHQRREQTDEEKEEADQLLAVIQEVAFQSGNLMDELFVSSSDALKAVNGAFNENWSARRLKQKLEAHIAAGRFPGVVYARRSDARGYMVRRCP